MGAGEQILRIRFICSAFTLKSPFPFVGTSLRSGVGLVASMLGKLCVSCEVGPQCHTPACSWRDCRSATKNGPRQLQLQAGTNFLLITIILCLITMHPSSLTCVDNSSFHPIPVILNQGWFCPLETFDSVWIQFGFSSSLSSSSFFWGPTEIGPTFYFANERS